MADAPGAVRYVGFWKRLFAFFVDTALFFAIFLPVALALYGTGFFGRARTEWVMLTKLVGEPNVDVLQVLAIIGQPDSALASVTNIWVQLALIVATVLFWKFRAATPGKMLVRARIVNATTMEPASTGQLIGRFFAYTVSMIPFCLGFLWIAFDKRKQGWHDKLAGTVVVEG